jgi:hypothetical protein
MESLFFVLNLQSLKFRYIILHRSLHVGEKEGKLLTLS